jgi:FKBP-type peptidyl-prolyl cis-trans isomerase SlyD
MIQTGDWVKINYTGRLADTNKVFDTTLKEIAIEENISQKTDFSPFIMCVGEGHIIKGIDKSLIGRNVGDKYKIDLSPEEAFGKKDPKLLQLISKSKFTQNRINPQPGLRVNIDNQEGIIKSISGGRVIVDFNHPLAGKEVIYEISVEEIIKDDKEKIKGYLKLLFLQDIPFDYENNIIKLKIPMQKEMTDLISKELSRMLDKEIKIEIPDQKPDQKKPSDTKNS